MINECQIDATHPMGNRFKMLAIISSYSALQNSSHSLAVYSNIVIYTSGIRPALPSCCEDAIPIHSAHT